MLRRLWKLTWLEFQIFVREPLGPGRLGRRAGGALRPPRPRAGPGGRRRTGRRARFGGALPVFSALLIAINAAISLVTIVSIYRESGILKRLRATPLGPLGDPVGARARQAGADGRHARRSWSWWAVLLPGRARCAGPLVRRRGAVRHLEHPVDWVRHCQPGADGEVRPAVRRASSSTRCSPCPGCSLRSVRCRCRRGRRADAAADGRGIAA